MVDRKEVASKLTSGSEYYKELAPGRQDEYAFKATRLALTVRDGSGQQIFSKLELKNHHSPLKVGNSVIKWRGKSNFRATNNTESISHERATVSYSFEGISAHALLSGMAAAYLASSRAV